VSSNLICLVGPTASGKSGLAIELAQQLSQGGTKVEIINADAMQLYRGMNIGTAKLPEEDRGEIPHHLFDVLDPGQEMTAVEYQEMARDVVAQVLDRGSVPLLVGGSMFYIAAAIDQLDFAPTDTEIRSALEREAEQAGSLNLHQRLSKLDPITAAKIPVQNVRRVIRALEVIAITGEPYSSSLPEPSYWRPTLQLGIAVEREVLKERIRLRVDQMWEQGILLETQTLMSQGEFSRTAKMAIGYKQAIEQLAGRVSEAEAKFETVALTNRYARRQMSWFRRDRRITWLDGSQELLSQAVQQIRL
jgi:tRNA dimethylallyltransferase